MRFLTDEFVVNSRRGLVWRRLGCLPIAVIAFSVFSRTACAETPGEGVSRVPLVAAPTLGGRQFWTDQLFFHGWRIQRNEVTGHCRLLDGKNRRHVRGSLDRCQEALRKIRDKKQLPPMEGKAVVLMHGLARARSSMQPMARFLHRKGDYETFNVSYASTRADIRAHAESLAKILDSLQGIDEINFVAHSLGNLVIRYYLNEWTSPSDGRLPDQRIHRIVMLGPPNGGARIAESIGRNRLFEFIAGSSGKQIASEWAELETRLAVPTCQFGIVAGRRGRNPLLQGEDDLVVRVEETRLAGAHDFVVMPVFHSSMMYGKQVQEFTLRFLQEGYFKTELERHPIPAIQEATETSRE